MNDKTKLGVRILAAALLLGVLGDALLRVVPWGINATLWTAALVAVVVPLAGRQAAFAGAGRWLLLPLLLFSVAFVWRDSPALKMLNVLALLVALALAVLRAQGGRILLAGIMEYIMGSLIAGLNAAVGLLPLLFGEMQWKEVLNNRVSGRALAALRGLVLALPVLVIFGGLFVAADAVFEGMVRRVLHVNFATLFSHTFLTIFFAWIVAGFLRGLLVGRERELATSWRPQVFSLGIIETGIVLGLLDLLFLLFVLVQLRYLFGGAALVGVTPGLTYSEYARRGFFELVAAAALVLPLLLLAHWLLRKEQPAHERIFRALAGVQILLLFVIMVSAVERMWLYQQEYGLTEQRLYPTAFMGWLAVVFVWFALTVLRGRRERFACGALVAGYLLIAVLHFLNPDAFIARTNSARVKAGRSFDARYATWLSADAAPELVSALPSLNQPDGCTVAASILKRWPPSEKPDWRTWSWGRAEARRVVNENAATLQAVACREKKD
jgi:hypothetical protein